MKTVLFVCTGNTCRSPMAECLFSALAREQGAPGVCAVSAGLCAPDGVRGGAFCHAAARAVAG